MSHKYCLGYSACGGQINGEENKKIVHVVSGKRTSGLGRQERVRGNSKAECGKQNMEEKCDKEDQEKDVDGMGGNDQREEYEDE